MINKENQCYKTLVSGRRRRTFEPCIVKLTFFPAIYLKKKGLGVFLGLWTEGGCVSKRLMRLLWIHNVLD